METQFTAFNFKASLPAALKWKEVKVKSTSNEIADRARRF
jgi:hypothetical protein